MHRDDNSNPIIDLYNKIYTTVQRVKMQTYPSVLSH